MDRAAMVERKTTCRALKLHANSPGHYSAVYEAGLRSDFCNGSMWSLAACAQVMSIAAVVEMNSACRTLKLHTNSPGYYSSVDKAGCFLTSAMSVCGYSRLKSILRDDGQSCRLWSCTVQFSTLYYNTIALSVLSQTL